MNFDFDKEVVRKIILGRKTILVLPLTQTFNFSLDKYINLNDNYKIMITKRETIGGCNELSCNQLKYDCGTDYVTDDAIYLAHVNYFQKIFPGYYREDSCYLYNFKLIKKVKSTMKLYVAVQKLIEGRAAIDNESRIVIERDGSLESYYEGRPLGGDFNMNSEGWEIVNVMNFTQAIESKANCVGLLSRSNIKYINGKLQNKDFLKDEVADIWIKQGK